MAILQVNELSTHYFLKESRVRAVDDVSFTVDKKMSFGLAGESGCGKTTTALSILRMLPSAGRIVKGQILLNDNVDLLKLSREEMRQARWRDVSYIFQYAMNAFNPVMNIGDQIVEVILEKQKRAKTQMNRHEAWKRVRDLFEVVGLDPERVRHYPHEFSGGMKQRAVIAMALACDPKIIIADEPVTALDVIVENKILKLLKKLQSQYDLALILITHDLSVIAETCQRVGIMYAGQLVEKSDASAIFKHSAHPYTTMLINAFPSILGEKKRIEPLAGIPPNLANPPTGCRFHPRCPLATEECRSKQPHLEEFKPGHAVACFHAGEY